MVNTTVSPPLLKIIQITYYLLNSTDLIQAGDKWSITIEDLKIGTPKIIAIIFKNMKVCF